MSAASKDGLLHPELSLANVGRQRRQRMLHACAALSLPVLISCCVKFFAVFPSNTVVMFSLDAAIGAGCIAIVCVLLRLGYCTATVERMYDAVHKIVAARILTQQGVLVLDISDDRAQRFVRAAHNHDGVSPYRIAIAALLDCVVYAPLVGILVALYLAWRQDMCNHSKPKHGLLGAAHGPAGNSGVFVEEPIVLGYASYMLFEAVSVFAYWCRSKQRFGASDCRPSRSFMLAVCLDCMVYGPLVALAARIAAWVDVTFQSDVDAGRGQRRLSFREPVNVADAHVSFVGCAVWVAAGYALLALLYRGGQLVLEHRRVACQVAEKGPHSVVLCHQDGGPSAARPAGFFYRDSAFLLVQDEDFWLDVVELEDGWILEVTMDTSGDYSFEAQRFPLEGDQLHRVEEFISQMRWTPPYHGYMEGSANYVAPERLRP